MVCQHYQPPEGYIPTMANPFLDHKYSMYVPAVIHIQFIIIGSVFKFAFAHLIWQILNMFFSDR